MTLRPPIRSAKGVLRREPPADITLAFAAARCYKLKNL